MIDLCQPKNSKSGKNGNFIVEREILGKLHRHRLRLPNDRRRALKWKDFGKDVVPNYRSFVDEPLGRAIFGNRVGFAVKREELANRLESRYEIFVRK